MKEISLFPLLLFLAFLHGGQPLFAQTCCQAQMAYGTPGELDQPDQPALVGSTLYVPDLGNSQIVLLNKSGGTSLAAVTNASFSVPRDLAADGEAPNPHLFMADSGADEVFVVDTSSNSVVNSFNGTGGTGAVFGAMDDPEGVCANAAGTTVLVSENAGKRLRVFTASGPTGTFLPQVQLTVPDGMSPIGLFMDPSGNVYAACSGTGHAIVKYAYSPAAGYNSTPSVLIQNPPGSLGDPNDVALDGSGDIYVANNLTATYEVYDPAGQLLTSCSGADGVSFNQPHGIYLDASQTAYLADTNNNRVVTFPACVPTPIPTYPGNNPPQSGQCFIYPSPAQGGHATLCYDMAQSGQMDLKILNTAGELAADITDQKPAGVQVTPFSLAQLAPGVYYYVVTLSYGSGQKVQLPPGKFAVIK